MQSTPASEIVRRGFAAFEQGDRDAIEAVLAEDFTFSSPPDPHLDRAGFFERCWPNNTSIRRFTFTRILEDGGEVFVTYELEKTDGKRGRNTEYFVVEDGRSPARTCTSARRSPASADSTVAASPGPGACRRSDSEPRYGFRNPLRKLREYAVSVR